MDCAFREIVRGKFADPAEFFRHLPPMEPLILLPLRIRAEPLQTFGHFAQNLRCGADGEVGEEEVIGGSVRGRWARIAAELMVAGCQCVASVVKRARYEDFVVLWLFLQPAMVDATDGARLRWIVGWEGNIRPPRQEGDVALREHGENVADVLPAVRREKLVRIEGENPIWLRRSCC